MKLKLCNGASTAVIDTVGACVDSCLIGGMECVVSKTDSGGGIDSVLFPIVGRLNGGSYTVGGKEYSLPIHGLLKSADMTVAENDGDRVKLVYRSTDEDKQSYPFDFEYSAEYALRERELYSCHTVRNIGKQPLYYSFGLHPSFLLDGAKSGKTNTGTDILRFRKQIEPHIWRLDDAGHFVVGKEDLRPVKEVHIDDALMREYGTLMLCDAPFRDVRLYTRGQSLWEIGFLPSPPILALWGEPSGEDGFICVEPWWGLNDFADPQPELSLKEGINCLAPGERAHYHAVIKKVR